jgi:hypothetical protein
MMVKYIKQMLRWKITENEETGFPTNERPIDFQSQKMVYNDCAIIDNDFII